MQFEGKVVFITGSTRGIGWATAKIFAAAGATVILNGRSDPNLVEARAKDLQEEYSTAAFGLAFDAADPVPIKQAYKAIFERYRRLDILVNNAGLLRSGVIGMMTDEMVRNTLSVNTIGPIHHTQEASRLMARNKSGAIVNVTSIAGRDGSEGQLAYSASKAALIGVTRSAAKELAPKGIRVNAVALGMIRTDLLNDLPQAKIEERTHHIRLGRLGDPEEVGQVIAFLCSDLASYVTGQVVGVDGGLVL
jgi:3-oxoacyl-[acyl-carrier protein] reductase